MNGREILRCQHQAVFFVLQTSQLFLYDDDLPVLGYHFLVNLSLHRLGVP